MAKFHEGSARSAAGSPDAASKRRICAHSSDNCIEADAGLGLPAWSSRHRVTTNTRSGTGRARYFADHCGAVAAITQPAYAEIVAPELRNIRWLAVTSHDAGARPAQAVSRGRQLESLFADSAPTARGVDRSTRPVPASIPQARHRGRSGALDPANALWGAKINAAHEDLHASDVHQPTCRCSTPMHWPIPCWRAVVGATCVIQPPSRRVGLGSRGEHGSTWDIDHSICMKALLEQECREITFPPVGHRHQRAPAFAAFGVKMIGWWGNDRDHHSRHRREVDQPNIPMSIGRAAPDNQIRITDYDDRPTEIGAPAISRSRDCRLSLFAEYLHNEKATRESFDEHGFFLTGDRSRGWRTATSGWRFAPRTC